MSNSRDDDLDIPSIVPERDEVASRSGRRVKSSSGSGGSGSSGGEGPSVPARSASGAASGPVRLLLSILTLAMLATGVGAWFFYTEGQRALAELENANGRLQALESRLSAVGEDTEETTLNLIDRIDLNFSEIDKLWAARNENRSNIADNSSTIEEHTEVIGSMENALESQADMLGSANSQLNNLQSRVDTITENVAAMEDIDQQIGSVQERLDELESSMDNLGPVANRVRTVEQDIESINVYRLQMNQTISTIRDQIQNLQQRVDSQQP